MSIALEWGDSFGEEGVSFIYFDAVQKYTKEYKGKVTEHPVDRQSNITDHYIRQNPKIHIQGYISGADLYDKTALRPAEEGGYLPDNATPAPRLVSVEERVDNSLPSALSQLFSTPGPVVDLDRTREGEADVRKVQDALKKAVGSASDAGIPLVTLYEYNGNTVTEVERELCITSLVFEEDPDSGDALYCDITLEQVEFAQESQSAFDEDVVKALQSKAAKKESKGKEDSTEQDVEKEKEDKLLRHVGYRVLEEIENMLNHWTGRGGDGG